MRPFLCQDQGHTFCPSARLGETSGEFDWEIKRDYAVIQRRTGSKEGTFRFLGLDKAVEVVPILEPVIFSHREPAYAARPLPLGLYWLGFRW